MKGSLIVVGFLRLVACWDGVAGCPMLSLKTTLRYMSYIC